VSAGARQHRVPYESSDSGLRNAGLSGEAVAAGFAFENRNPENCYSLNASYRLKIK